MEMKSRPSDPVLVEADSVADYLGRYYKKGRMTETLLVTYEEQFAEFGFVSTSHHDNTCGVTSYWPKFPTWLLQCRPWMAA